MNHRFAEQFNHSLQRKSEKWSSYWSLQSGGIATATEASVFSCDVVWSNGVFSGDRLSFCLCFSVYEDQISGLSVSPFFCSIYCDLCAPREEGDSGQAVYCFIFQKATPKGLLISSMMGHTPFFLCVTPLFSTHSPIYYKNTSNFPAFSFSPFSLQ